MSIDDFRIIKTKRDYIVLRESMDVHSHFRHRNACNILLDFIKSDRLPHNQYFLKALQRILTNEELRNFKQPKKQRYVNTR